MDLETVKKRLAELKFTASGNSYQTGTTYQEFYFEELSSMPALRGGSKDRVKALEKHIDFSGKLVLDIGCNLGFFCYALNESGAKVIGIDHDKASIEAARLMQQHYKREGIEFIEGAFDLTFCHKLKSEHGYPDVILLNSVVHWLLYAHGSIERVAALISTLLTDEKQQSIVYEPSSTGAAYYPECLSTEGVREFFAVLGIFDVKKICSFYVTNSGQVRDYYLGLRDAQKTADQILEALKSCEEDSLSGYHDQFGKLHLKRRHKGKIVLVYENLVIKSHESKSPLSAKLIAREHDMLKMFCSEFAPFLLFTIERGGRKALVFKRFHGKALNQSWVMARDVPFIERELDRALEDLSAARITHNDLRPHNLLWDSRRKKVQIIDFEWAVCLPPDCADAFREGEGETEFLKTCSNDEERAFIKHQLSDLGGKWRSAAGLFSLANDRFAVKTTVYLLKNRWRYCKRRTMELASVVVRRVVKLFKP